LKSLKKLQRQKKTWWNKDKRGNWWSWCSTKMEQTQLALMFLVVKPKLKLKNNPVFFLIIVKPTWISSVGFFYYFDINKYKTTYNDKFRNRFNKHPKRSSNSWFYFFK
jgi:hypothetical protein